MIDHQAIASCDFSVPRRLSGEAGRALSGWHRTFCSVLHENWNSLLGVRVDFSLGRIDTTTGGKSVQTLHDPGFGVRLRVGPTGFPALLSFSGKLIRSLVEDVLGTGGDTWPDSAPFTPVEFSIVDLLFGEVSRSLGHAWPQIEPLLCNVDTIVEKPRRSRIFAPEEILLKSPIHLETRHGTDQAMLLMPLAGLQEIGITEETEADTQIEPARGMQELAEQLPVTLVVELGSATLSLKELDRLEVGDVLVLDQSVTRPLRALVGNQLQWLGSPCRLGRRQGFKIGPVVSEDS